MKKFGLWLVVLGVVACDIPTELPILEPRLVFEAERSTITADQLLPANVTVQGNSFLVTFTTATVTRTLGEACPSCAQFNGQTAPKPAFTAAFPPATVSLPTGVRSATLSNNVLNLQVFNGLSFDPLRPSATARGTLAVRITSAGTVLADTVLSGQNIALPAGQNTTIPVPLRPVTVANTANIVLEITLVSPAGDPALINTNAQLRVTPASATASSAVVDVVNRVVSVRQTELDLEDIDQGVIDHVKSGALVVVMNNPFNIAGTFSVRFTPAVVSTKTVPVAPGATAPRIQFTQAELRQLLGRSVLMNISGPVTGPAGGITVTPNQFVDVSTRVDVVLTTADTT